MKLIIIRHGDPDYSKDSLTEKGWHEAELLSERISKLCVDAFYVSPLGRAQDTASLTLKKMNRTAETLDWLEEFAGYAVDEKTGQHCLAWDQLPSSWTADNRNYDREDWMKVPFISGGNVSVRFEYVCSEFDRLLEKHGYRREGNIYRAVRSNNDTVVLFCHFGVECVLLSHLLGISPVLLWHGFVALPTSVTTLITEEREDTLAYFRCNGFGDISHLYAGNEPPAFAARFCESFANVNERH